MRPSRDTTLMGTAYLWEQRSTCDRNHVGAVISVDSRIIVTGYNGAPAGMAHCDHTCTCVPADADEWKGRPANWTAGGPVFHLDACPKTAPCAIAVHAEANAIAFAARNGLRTDGAELHVTLTPCYACAKLIINAGLRRVVYDRPYRDRSGLDLFERAGIETMRLEFTR